MSFLESKIKGYSVASLSVRLFFGSITLKSCIFICREPETQLHTLSTIPITIEEFLRKGRKALTLLSVYGKIVFVPCSCILMFALFLILQCKHYITFLHDAFFVKVSKKQTRNVMISHSRFSGMFNVLCVIHKERVSSRSLSFVV